MSVKNMRRFQQFSGRVASLETSIELVCEPQGADNVRRQISTGNFKANLMLWYLSSFKYFYARLLWASCKALVDIFVKVLHFVVYGHIPFLVY